MCMCRADVWRKWVFEALKYIMFFLLQSEIILASEIKRFAAYILDRIMCCVVGPQIYMCGVVHIAFINIGVKIWISRIKVNNK